MIAWISRETGRAPRFWGSALIVGAACLAYANSLGAGFHYDDGHHIVGNPFLRDPKYWLQFFHRPDLFSALEGHHMYRPLVLLSYALNYHQGGYDPLPWRLTAIALHALTAVGVFLTIRFLAAHWKQRPRRAAGSGALVAALVFAVHPLFTEAVDYASARSSLLATCFLVWALLAHLGASRTPKGARRVALWLFSLLLFTAALLSKEIAIVFPALLLLAAWLDRRGYLAVVPAAIVALLYLWARHTLLGAAVLDFAAREAARATADAGSGGARPLPWNLYTQARVVATYLAMLLFPHDLTPNRYVRVSETPFEGPVVLSGLLLLGLLLLGLRGRARRPLPCFGILWFYIALAPTSSIIPLNQIMNEHRLYLPATGLAIALATVAWRLPRIAKPAVVLALIGLTLDRNRDWNDPVRLWESAVAASPQSDGSWNSLGVQRRLRGDAEGARGAFERARQLAPHSWDATFNLGTLLLQVGRERGDHETLDEAQRCLIRSLELRPDATRSRWFLAETLLELRRPEQAEAIWRALACESTRLYEMTRYPLAALALERGRPEEAEQLYKEALAEGSDPVPAWLGLGRVALERGDRREAARCATEALAVRLHAGEPHLFLARLYAGSALGARHLIEAERRGVRVTEAERRSILMGKD